MAERNALVFTPESALATVQRQKKKKKRPSKMYACGWNPSLPHACRQYKSLHRVLFSGKEERILGARLPVGDSGR